jgi:hypothetical protein
MQQTIVKDVAPPAHARRIGAAGSGSSRGINVAGCIGATAAGTSVRAAGGTGECLQWTGRLRLQLHLPDKAKNKAVIQGGDYVPRPAPAVSGGVSSRDSGVTACVSRGSLLVNVQVCQAWRPSAEIHRSPVPGQLLVAGNNAFAR